MQKTSCFILSLIALSLTVFLGGACTNDDYTFSSFHCNLLIDNSTHQDPTLASAMTPTTPGIFCLISYEASRRAYRFMSNQGQSSYSGFDDKDNQRGNAQRIGMNNGIIVGYGNLSAGDGVGTYEFFAYDAQCPNCFDYNALPLRNYPLTMGTNGIATCANCKRQYNMNSGGNCTNPKAKGDKGLTRYRATSSNPLGRLFVN